MLTHCKEHQKNGQGQSSLNEWILLHHVLYTCRLSSELTFLVIVVGVIASLLRLRPAPSLVDDRNSLW